MRLPLGVGHPPSVCAGTGPFLFHADRCAAFKGWEALSHPSKAPAQPGKGGSHRLFARRAAALAGVLKTKALLCRQTAERFCGDLLCRMDKKGFCIQNGITTYKREKKIFNLLFRNNSFPSIPILAHLETFPLFHALYQKELISHC